MTKNVSTFTYNDNLCRMTKMTSQNSMFAATFSTRNKVFKF